MKPPPLLPSAFVFPMSHSRRFTAEPDRKQEKGSSICCSQISLKKRSFMLSDLKEINGGTHFEVYLLHGVRLRLKRRPDAGPSSAGDTEIKWPASQPRRPVAASATPSRLLKGDTIPINVFLSTLLRCLFNTVPGGFRARAARVKLHFSGLKERCDKSLMQVRDSQGPSGSKQPQRTDKGC